MQDFIGAPLRDMGESNPISTDLNSLIQAGATADKKYSTLIGHNLGNNTLLLRVSLYEFNEISEVANARNIGERGGDDDEVAQRNLDHRHAGKLAVYILKGVISTLAKRYTDNDHPIPFQLEQIQEKLGKQPYMALQPITANIRTCQFGGKGLRLEPIKEGFICVYLSTRDVLWVVDGQHRRAAIKIMFEYLRMLVHSKHYPKKPILFPVTDNTRVPDDELRIWDEIFEVARSTCTIMVECHLGLSPEQERQLFHDLNNLTKKIESSLAFQYDQSNHVNMWLRENLIESGVLKPKVIERDIINWDEDNGTISRKELISINAILFLNKTNVRGAKPQQVARAGGFALKFWEAVNKIPLFGQPGAKMKTVAVQSVAIKALAKLSYDFAFGKYKSEPSLRLLMSNIPKLPFTHSEPMWRYYQLTPKERKEAGLSGLEKYLPPEGSTIRDIGVYHEGVMKFSMRHNDVYPILGDMIRWKLSLPSRFIK